MAPVSQECHRPRPTCKPTLLGLGTRTRVIVTDGQRASAPDAKEAMDMGREDGVRAHNYLR